MDDKRPTKKTIRPEPVAELRKPKEAPMSDFRPYTESAANFILDVEPGVTLADIQRPKYWRNVCHMMRARNRATHMFVKAVAKDRKWIADLYVYGVGDGYAKCYVVNEWHAPTSDRAIDLPAKWNAAYVGDGWRVMNSENEVIVKGHPTEDDAIAAAARYFKDLAA